MGYIDPELYLEADEEQDIATEGPNSKVGWFNKAFKFMYFRFKAVRTVANRIQDALWAISSEYESAQIVWEGWPAEHQSDSDEGYGSQEDDVEDWGTPQVVAISVA